MIVSPLNKINQYAPMPQAHLLHQYPTCQIELTITALECKPCKSRLRGHFVREPSAGNEFSNFPDEGIHLLRHYLVWRANRRRFQTYRLHFGSACALPKCRRYHWVTNRSGSNLSEIFLTSVSHSEFRRRTDRKRELRRRQCRVAAGSHESLLLI